MSVCVCEARGDKVRGQEHEKQARRARNETGGGRSCGSLGLPRAVAVALAAATVFGGGFAQAANQPCALLVCRQDKDVHPTRQPTGLHTAHHTKCVKCDKREAGG
ncbi:hypothetical protein SORBI_3003G067900 [Sorghum bicolor]|uniref:Uncharacterized protein n=1 Tax=Sorghum bicolor TaxID=4558 RepID=A0A1B6Q1P8_SORBI|nr:hypothetical protein SORBI_3003G067900 [Sorghum bicolor]